MKTSICDSWEFTRRWNEDFLNFQGEGEMVELPHNPVELPLHYVNHEEYQLVCGYRRKLVLPEDISGKRYFLQFDGAAHIATVFVNGMAAGEHRCGYTAFRLEITGLVKPGENDLALRLDTTENKEIPPFGFVVDYLTYGGLYREAWLIEKNYGYIEDVYITTPTVDRAVIQVQARDFSGDIDISIFDPQGEAIWNTCGRKNQAEAQRLNVRPWRPEDPNRYTCRVRLLDGSGILDEETVVFGFRTAEFGTDGFYLNGEKFFLRGLNRHQSFPYIGYAATESLQREDARILKEELHCTAVRTSHYPQSQYFIDECDRLGLLVFTEIPGWQHIGDEHWKEQAIHNVEEMVLQYRNHPSVILWGVRINESVDDDSFYKQTNKLARKLDPSRATSGVRYLEKSKLLEDVYAFNDFSHTGNNPGCKPKKKITTNMQKGFLISEHNGHMFPTKSFDPWAKRQEHALRHMRVLNDAYASGEHAGCFGWCMFDYPTHKDFGSGDRVCYHGVMDAFRNPKTAAYAYASQGEEGTVLEVASSMDIGDYPGGEVGNVAVFSNADEVALYKDDCFVTKLNRSQLSALPHPPFVVDDTIGVLLESQEGFDHAKAELLRQCLTAAAKYGLSNLPFKIRLKFAWCMLRYRVRYEDAVALYGKYVGNWGGESTRWRFEAMVRGKCVKSVTRSASCKLHLEARPTSQRLHIGDTYDMAAVRIRILDEWGCVASYAQLPLSFAADGEVALLGPETATAEGGMCGAYVRTTGRPGPGILVISAPGLESVTVEFAVDSKHIPALPEG